MAAPAVPATDPLQSGLTALANRPVIGPSGIVSDEEQQKALDSLQSAEKALQQRYENPNWFNVAAGFFKPQLGGFAASLGSASQALGDWQEQQRANELPLFNVRAQVGSMQAQMRNRQAAGKAFTEAQQSGFKPEELPKLQAKLESLGAADLAGAVGKMIDTQQKESGLKQQAAATKSTDYNAALKDLELQYQSGTISQDELAKRSAVLRSSIYGDQSAPSGAGGEKLPEPGGAPGAGGAPTIAGAAESLRGMERGAFLPQTEPTIIKSAWGSHVTGITPATREREAAKAEEKARERMQALADAGGADEIYKPLKETLVSTKSLIRENPEMAKKVMSMAATGTLGSQIMAILQSGIGLNFQGIAGNVHIDVDAARKAGLDEKDRMLFDQLAQNFATLAVARQRVGGLSPNAARNAELGLYSDMVPTMKTTVNSAIKSLEHYDVDLDAANARHRFVQDVMNDRNPDVKLAKGTPNPMDAIINHPVYNEVYAPFSGKHRQINEAYQEIMNRKKKP